MRLRPSSLLLALAACGSTKATTPVACPAEIAIAGQDDVARYATCTSAKRLVIKTGMALDLKPLALASVDELTIGPSVGLEDVTFTQLERAGSITVASNANLGGVYLPKLAHAESIRIEANGRMKMLAMKSLATAGTIAVVEANALEMLEASTLASVTTLSINGAPELTLLELDALAKGKVTLDGAPKLDAALVARLVALP